MVEVLVSVLVGVPGVLMVSGFSLTSVFAVMVEVRGVVDAVSFVASVYVVVVLVLLLVAPWVQVQGPRLVLQAWWQRQVLLKPRYVARYRHA